MGQTATGRPAQRIPALPTVALVFAVFVVTMEALRDTAASNGPGSGLARAAQAGWPGLFARYAAGRAWVLEHPWGALGLAALASVLFLIAYRYWLLFWHNEVVARLTGTKFVAEEVEQPFVQVDLLKEIARRPPKHHFVGLQPRRGFFRTKWEPVYLSPTQRSMHRHVLGKTGSGKTLSVLWPSVLQAALDGQGVVVVSGKGSNEEVLIMKGIAALTGRREHLRVLSLPAWNQPQLFTHSYNFVYVRPRTPTDPGGDPVAMADRVFRCLVLGDNEYYNVQAQIMLSALARLLHGMVDEHGRGFPFVLRDLLVCFRGIGGEVGGFSRALEHCLQTSRDRDAARAVQSQIQQLGKDVNKCFSGIVGALDKFQSPIVNAYDPDIVFEDVLEKAQLVYVQAPANLFPIQAPALGKAVLTDVQQEGSLRQVFRTSRSQTPFSVVVDEFYNFADITMVDSLNKLRDAKLEYTLAHQSIADLELVSKEFATAVWDNTRTKDILAQDNPELCEKVAKSIGTVQLVEKTVRQQQGALFTALQTGDASTKLVEAFRLHPNRIKHLKPQGQGYFLFGGDAPQPVCYGMLPPMDADYALPRKDQSRARGLRLYETFVAPDDAAAAAAGH